tara:strand:+ start:292 stop:498 length:207 start_codon:yes stop_codon:yes gene_type:complete
MPSNANEIPKPLAETTLTRAALMIERMAISLAIQEAINQKALHVSPADRAMLDEFIAELALQQIPAEA